VVNMHNFRLCGKHASLVIFSPFPIKQSVYGLCSDQDSVNYTQISKFFLYG
jgi:hypothetical protein